MSMTPTDVCNKRFPKSEPPPPPPERKYRYHLTIIWDNGTRSDCEATSRHKHLLPDKNNMLSFEGESGYIQVVNMNKVYQYSFKSYD